jgi:Core-2/I-Branching enzyme
VSVAYVILAHRGPKQLARLLERLYHLEDRAFVHVDKRAPLEPFETALAPLVASGHVQFARRRFRSRWADWTLVAATLATLEQALQEATFSHVSLLSGEDYPLVPTATIRAFLAAADNRSFMFHSSGDGATPPDRSGNRTWYWSGDLRRVTYRHYRVLGRQVHVPNRFMPDLPRLAPPRDLDFYQGSQWWTLSREAAQYCVEAFIRRPELRRFFRRVYAPDEYAFQMVLCNSPLLPTIVNDDLHFIQWSYWHPRELTLDDLPMLSDTPKLFTRKIDETRQPRLLAALDELIESRASDHGRLLTSLRERFLEPGAYGP